MPKTGYHYTSWSNWLNIKKVGLIPYVINKPELRRLFPGETIKGVWTWLERPTGQSELGSIIFQASTKQETKIVCLAFPYHDPEEVLHFEGKGKPRKITLKHDGFLGSWMYHEKQKAYIVENAIPPEDITLVKVFDLMDITKEVPRG